MTSISAEEVNTFQDLFGSSAKWKLRNYARYYQNMMLKKEWSFQTDVWNNRGMKFITNKPFRLGLAHQINKIHFFVYPRDSCKICDPEYESKRMITSRNLVDHFVKAYDKEKARSMLRLYSFARHGLKVIDSKRLALWHSIAEFDKSNSINWIEVNEILDNELSRKRSRQYIKKDIDKRINEELNSKSTLKIKPEEVIRKTPVI